jgi:hypothetical protein
MALLEMWWGSTEHPASEGVTSDHGPAGITIKGNVSSGSHKVTAHFFASVERLAKAGAGAVHCASAPVAVLSGNLDAYNGGSLIGDGDPHTKFTHRLRQAAFIGGRLVAEARSEHVLADVTGDNKRKQVTLGPEGFPPLVFGLVPGAELRIDLEFEIDSHYHKTFKRSSYQAVLQLPQWGIILGVGG